MTDELLSFLSNDELLNNFDFHFNNFSPFTASPEKNLMISVLLNAVIDYLYSNKKESEEAKIWLYETEEEDWLYSFDNVCFVLGIQKLPFREGLLVIKESPISVARAKRLKHLYPAPGNRNKISANFIYEPRKKYDDFN